jgi:diaminopimelate epimerase
MFKKLACFLLLVLTVSVTAQEEGTGIDPAKFLRTLESTTKVAGLNSARKKNNDFSVRIINCDGSEALMCGNAARIAVAYESSLTSLTQFKFETLNSIYSGEFINNESIIYMSELFDVDKYDISDLGVLGGLYLNTGVPHTVIETKNIEAMDLVKEGQKIRYDERFDGGTNVCFFEVIKKNEIKFRVYERGIEGETHCCGTGVIATAITCKKIFNWSGEILVHCLGGEVHALIENNYKDLVYRGKVDLCFRGQLNL